MDLEARLRDAVQHFWDARARQKRKQVDAGRIDAGTHARGSADARRIRPRSPMLNA